MHEGVDVLVGKRPETLQFIRVHHAVRARHPQQHAVEAEEHGDLDQRRKAAVPHPVAALELDLLTPLVELFPRIRVRTPTYSWLSSCNCGRRLARLREGPDLAQRERREQAAHRQPRKITATIQAVLGAMPKTLVKSTCQSFSTSATGYSTIIMKRTLACNVMRMSDGKHRRKLDPISALGEIFVTFGVIALLFAFYEVYWTDISSGREQAIVAGDLDSQWDSRNPRPLTEINEARLSHACISPPSAATSTSPWSRAPATPT